MRRHIKKPRIAPPPVDDSSSSSEEEEEDEEEEEADQKIPARRRNHVAREPSKHEEEAKDDDARVEALIARGKWAFCCAKCACSDEDRVRAQELKYLVSGDGRFPHRPCCHRVFEKSPPREWATSFETAMADVEEHMLQEMEEGNKEPSVMDGTTEHATANAEQMHRSYNSTKNMESKFVNHRKAEDPTTRLYTNADYKKETKAFLKRVEACQTQTNLRGAVVLDLFSGMGTLLVALKRLSIALDKVIHCEKDKVATYVYQQQHNEQNTEWIHYQSFESIDEEGYDAFMDAHAPIDILAAGPPCQDFSGINATKKGLDGHKGVYMIRTAKLATRIRKDTRQAGRPLYYLLENVVLGNDKDLPLDQGTRERIKNALGCSWDPVELDAAYVSPCQRLRSFFTNVPLGAWGEQADAYMDCNPTSVLQDGFRMAANLERYKEEDLMAKTLTFMASKERIDDHRMLAYRRRDPSSRDEKYIERFITRSERLQLMGFPSNYLDSLETLYETLLHNGHDTAVGSKHWSETLEPRFHHFQGAFHGVSNPFDFTDVPAPANSFPPRRVEMKLLPYMASPSEYLNSDRYGKRLVGNAMSVPVLEFCLSELTKVFGRRQYEGYDYTYAWRNREEQA